MQSEITTYKRNSRGFTLIELMIVVALIGIVSSMAMAAYSSYLQTASAQAMVSNFESAIKTTKANYLVARQLRTIGASVTRVIHTNSDAWANAFNHGNARAPGGGDAYETGAGNGITGAVGVEFSGSYASRDSVVTLHRPAFAGVGAETVAIAQISF